MRLFAFNFLAIVASLFLHGSEFDERADEQILGSLASTEFCNVTLNYLFEDAEYPITIVHNPMREFLWGPEFDKPVTWSLAVIADLPSRLRRHLNLIISEDEEESYVDLMGYASRHAFASLYPVYISETLEDPTIDEIANEVFSSNRFMNQVFYYFLDGNYYKVRILYNPDKVKVTSTKNFRLTEGGPMNGYTISWAKKYAIVTDRKAPQTLIDRFTTLANISNWDYYFNFDIYNGDYVTYEVNDMGFFVDEVTTYTLDSWFNYAENFK